MGERETWRTVLAQPRGILTVGLAGAGALIVTALLIVLPPDLSGTVQIGVLVIAGLCYLALTGGAFGFLYAQVEGQQRRVVENDLVQEKERLESTQEQTKRLLSLQEQTLLYAQDLSDAVQRERLRVDELDSLQRVSMAVLSELSLESVLDMVTEAVATLTQADTASVSLLTADDRMRTHVAAYGLAADALRGTSSPADTALHGWVIKSGDPLLVDNLRDTGWRQGRSAIRRDGKKTAVVAPLKVRDRVIGCLSAFDKKLGQPFDEHDLQLLSLFASQAAIAIENARLYEQVHHDLETKSEQMHNVQHRVRESLSLVRDLLSAELDADSTRLAAGESGAVQSTIRRIQITAQVYDLLAQHDFASLGFGELAESVAGLIQTDLETDTGQHIDLVIDEGEALLSPRQATPLALIASELVSEAAQGATGEIDLRARATDGEITVQIRGHGMDALADEASRRIVQTLVETHLQGRMHVATESDTVTVIIKFPEEARPPTPQPPIGIPLDADIEPPSFLHTKRP